MNNTNLKDLERKLIFYLIDMVYMMLAVGAILWESTFALLGFVILVTQDIVTCLKSIFEDDDKFSIILNVIAIVVESVLLFLAIGVYYKHSEFITILQYGSLVCLFRTVVLVVRFGVKYLKLKF